MTEVVKKNISLKLVAEIDGVQVEIKTANFTDSINDMIKDGYIGDNNESIVEHLTDAFYDGDSGI